LIQNVFARTLVLQSEDRLPSGTVNEYASQNLLPAVFRYVVRASDQDALCDVTSFEVAAIAKFFSVNEREPSEVSADGIRELVEKLGNRYLYDEKLDHLVPRDPFERVLEWLKHNTRVSIHKPDSEELNKDWFRYLAVIARALRADLREFGAAQPPSGKVDSPGPDLPLAEICHVVALRDRIGRARLANAMKWLAKAPEDQSDDGQDQWLSALLSDPHVMSPAVILTPEVLNVLRTKAHAHRLLGEVLDRAGALLADTIALVRATYHDDIKGVILGGGVLKERAATGRILASIKRHLWRRYRLDLAGCSGGQRQLGLSTVYCNILGVDENGAVFSKEVVDKANEGCIRHARIMHAADLGKP
jgi:hypothetical protein